MPEGENAKLIDQFADACFERESTNNTPENWIPLHDRILALMDLGLKARELEAWKESAMKLLPLQEWGVAMGLKLGEDIHSQVLPALLKAQRIREETLEECAKLADRHALSNRKLGDKFADGGHDRLAIKSIMCAQEHDKIAAAIRELQRKEQG